MQLLLIIFIGIDLILTLFSFLNFIKEKDKPNLKKLLINLGAFIVLMIALIILK